MPPHPPNPAKRAVRALLTLALPLALGFVTGGVVASDLARVTTEGEDLRVVRPPTPGLAHREPNPALLAFSSPIPEHAPDPRPTRRSVQEAVDEIDPRAWLARYGEVAERPAALAPAPASTRRAWLARSGEVAERPATLASAPGSTPH